MPVRRRPVEDVLGAAVGQVAYARFGDVRGRPGWVDHCSIFGFGQTQTPCPWEVFGGDMNGVGGRVPSGFDGKWANGVL